MDQATSVLKDTRDIGIVRFADGDVVRHELVGTIARAYEKFENRKN